VSVATYYKELAKIRLHKITKTEVQLFAEFRDGTSGVYTLRRARLGDRADTLRVGDTQCLEPDLLILSDLLKNIGYERMGSET
jgi:hypothetical protein